MKKIAFITPECFLDVDLPIVVGLNDKTELFWITTYAVVADNEKHIFNPEEIECFSKTNGILHLNILCPFRVRDPRRIKTAMKIIRKIMTFKPDVVYFDSFYDPYLAILSRIFLGKRKTIVAVHDIELHKGADSLFHKLNNIIILNLFHFYHIFSKTQLAHFRSRFPKKKAFLIRLFLKNFGEINKKRKFWDKRKMNFLFFGTDLPYKGLDVLIKAVSLLSDKTNEFTVTLAGKCNEFDKYKDLINDISVYNLHLEFIESVNIPALFNTADFLILPYYEVTQCGPMLISYYYGVPVIASDLSEFSENVIDKETGFLFKCGDYNHLCQILENVITSEKSKVNDMRKHLSQYVNQNYNLNDFITSYLEMFSLD